VWVGGGGLGAMKKKIENSGRQSCPISPCEGEQYEKKFITKKTEDSVYFWRVRSMGAHNPRPHDDKGMLETTENSMT